MNHRELSGFDEEVKRYSIHSELGCPVVSDNKNGGWVDYQDYKKLLMKYKVLMENYRKLEGK